MKANEIWSSGEIDARFDAGEDVSDAVNWLKARRANVETRRVIVDFPAWVIAALDRRSRERGVTRKSLIKLWIAERLQ